MALTSRELIDLATKRISQVQQKLKPTEQPSSLVYQVNHTTDLFDALAAMQLYVDQLLLDRSFPWEIHWAPHLTEFAGDRVGPFKTRVAAQSAIRAFMTAHELQLSSSQSSQKGTLEQLRLGVLLHSTQLLSKLFPNPATPRLGKTLPDVVQNAQLLDPVPPPSGDVCEPVVADGTISAPEPESDPHPTAVSPPRDVPNATAGFNPRQPRIARTVPRNRGAGHSNQTPEGLARDQYVEVNMRVANNVCRPHSARQLNPNKSRPSKIAAMVEALDRAAPAVNASDPTEPESLSAPHAVSRWRKTLESATQGEQRLHQPNERIDESNHILSTSKPSIRRPTAAKTREVMLAQSPVRGAVVAASSGANVVATNAWGVREREHGQAHASKWVMVSHHANSTTDLARHSLTVAVTSTLSSRPSVTAAEEKETKTVKGSWTPQHDVRWVGPQWATPLLDD